MLTSRAASIAIADEWPHLRHAGAVANDQGGVPESHIHRVVDVALDAAERGGALVYRPRLFALRDAAGGTAG
jgi:hypothetical protein